MDQRLVALLLTAVLTLLSTGQAQHYLATLKAVDLDARREPGGGFSFPFPF